MAINVITEAQLNDLLQLKDEKDYFVIDCRSFLLYNKCHVRGAVNIRCNSIMRRRSKGCFALENAITNVDRRNDFLAGKYSLIILYDDQGGDVSARKDTPVTARRTISMVTEALQLKALESTHIAYLDGGFKSFASEYPQACDGSTNTGLTLTGFSKDTNTPCTPTPIYDQGVPVEILPHLYLGSAYHASQKHEMKSLGITALLNASSTCENHFESDFRYKRIPVEDNSHADISSWFNEAISFINDEKERGGKVFVHCHAGVSRSATICLAYLITCHRISLSDAFRYVKLRRSVISPNFNFMGQLLKLESDVAAQNDKQPAHNDVIRNDVDSSTTKYPVEEMEWQNENIQNTSTVRKPCTTNSCKLYRRRALTSSAPLVQINNQHNVENVHKGCQTAPPRQTGFNFFPETTRSCSQQNSMKVSHSRHSRTVTLST